MRLSRMFGHTLRDVPAEAEAPSHILALRAGLIHPLAAGIFSYLPMGLRVKRKIEGIVREEMQDAGCFEALMPVVQPAELWRSSGRWGTWGSEMVRMKDRSGREMCLAVTHEETATEMATHVIRSYRQLPLSLFQIQTKFRDEPRSRGGLIRAREFTMKDAYSFHADAEDLDRHYQRLRQAYESVFRRAGLGAAVVSVESDPGMMGGTEAHEFTFLNPVGEDAILLCDGCGYRANRQVAACAVEDPPDEAPLPVEEVHTPGCRTISELSAFLGVDWRRTAKAVFLSGRVGGKDRLIFALVRGDHDLNESKVARAAGAGELRPATDEEIRRAGAEPGYGSPVGVSGDALVVADHVAVRTPNLVAGANREGYHLWNVNAGRDYRPDITADLISVTDGMACPRCRSALRSARGVEVGNLFKLGTRYSQAMGATFLDEGGEARPLVMGCYGLGIDRMLACIIEAHHDARGIIWPPSVAPFQAHLVVVNSRTPAGELEAAESICRTLEGEGIEVLLDDREERAGVKFNDADLIGIPIRVTVGARGLGKGCVEVKRRSVEETVEVPVGRISDHLRNELEDISSTGRGSRDTGKCV